MKNTHSIYCISCVVILLVSVLFLHPFKVLAHTLEVDGSIGITMHVDPDDSPIAEAPAKFYIYFKDESNKLDLAHCDCSIMLSKSVISNPNVPLDQLASNIVLLSENTDSLSSSSTITVDTADQVLTFPFVFPSKGIYKLEVKGQPSNSIASTSFQSFDLTYSIRVDQVATGSSTPTFLQEFLSGHFVHLILFGGAAIFALVLVVLDRKERKKI